MTKKCTLIVLVTLITSAPFISCSSNDLTEQNQGFSYNITPPIWLQGKWKNSNNDQFIFTTDDIQYSDVEGASWKFLHNSWEQTIENNKAKFYEKSETDTYYEAEYLYYEGFLDSNIKVNKTGNNSIEIKYTYFEDDGSIINTENFTLTKAN